MRSRFLGWKYLAGKVERLSLLRTKFYRPRAAGALIRRSRVYEILNNSLDRTLTLVSAPAGFGKTTLLSDWLDSCPLPSAWLSLDEGDSNVGVFLRYFAGAVQTLFPEACGDTLAHLQAPALPPLNSLVTTLANDLDHLADGPDLSSERRFVLVLDDFHLLKGEAVHALLGELLRHPPRALHLVVSTRQDPPFPLHALRARGELSEVRARELRFTGEEVAGFMEQALGSPLDHDAVATVAERTEGWATGLRLAALTLSTGGDVANPGLAVDNRYVLDYLLNEVFARVPVATHDFLLKTSILRRLCGPLCDAVAGPAGAEWDGRAYLDWLAKENLFTFSLDALGTWYRYHHLFQKLLHDHLERRFSAPEIAALHARASAWLGEHGLIDEAIEHALKAGDENAAIQLIEAHRHKAINQEQWPQLERWLSIMPRRLIDTRPELVMLEAWSLHSRFRLADLAACLDRAEATMKRTALAEPVARRLQGELEALRSQVLYWSAGPLGTLEAAQTALNLVAEEFTYARTAGVTYYAGALQLQGKLGESVAVVGDALKEEGFHGHVAQARLLFVLCAVYLMEADTFSLIQTANRLLIIAQEAGLADSLTRSHFYLGCAYYQMNDLEAAEKHFRFVVERRYMAYGLIAAQSGFGLASTYQAQRLPERARATLGVVADYAVAMNNAGLLADVKAYGAHLALMQGRSADADALAAQVDHRIRSAPMPVFYVASFTLTTLLLSQGTRVALQRAEQDLARLQEIVGANHNTRFLIEVLALQSLLQAEQGDRIRALATLKQAIDLAEPRRLIRVFVDLGPKMTTLLRDLAGRGEGSGYVNRLLSAFGETPDLHLLTQNLAGQAQAGPTTPRNGGLFGHRAGPPALIEPLSQRELEVLALLSERLSNKEIAKELCISPMTVKRHTVNIYEKLAVGGRRDAVAKAYELSLFSAPPGGSIPRD